MRRCNARNSDLGRRVVPAVYTTEYFELFRRYLTSRHVDGAMADPSASEFSEFLLSSWCETFFMEWRAPAGELLAVAVTDRLRGALSAVYTFFDPHCQQRSLGTYAVLQQIDFARQERLDWLYLGYWIDGCQKMSYKRRFHPHQVLSQDAWQEVD